MITEESFRSRSILTFGFLTAIAGSMPVVAQIGASPANKNPAAAGVPPAAKNPSATGAPPVTTAAPTAVAVKAPGVVGAAQTIKATATVTVIDYATREVTLKGPQGNAITVVAGPEVKKLEQVKVGDQVNLEYTEAFTVSSRRVAPKWLA